MDATANTFEVEVKYRVAKPEALRKRMLALGAQAHGEQRHEDRYFAHPCRDFAATDEALRIRLCGEAVQLTYKGPKIDTATKTRRELELALPTEGPAEGQTAETLQAVLEALGFEPLRSVVKTRQRYSLDWQGFRVAAAIDHVASLGTFAELEVAASEPQVDAARTAVLALADELGLSEGERRSYLELLLGTA